MLFLRSIALAASLFLVACESSSKNGNPLDEKGDVTTIQVDGYERFSDFLDEVGKRMDGRPLLVHLQGTGDEPLYARFRFYPLPPNIDPVYLMLRGETVTMGEDEAALSFDALRERMDLFREAAEVAGNYPLIMIHAQEDVPFSYGVEVLGVLASRGIDRIVLPPEGKLPAVPQGKKPSSPTGG